MDDAAMSLPAHGRQQQADKLVRAEQVRLELFTQDFNRQVLDGAGLAMGCIVEERVKHAPGGIKHGFNSSADGIAIAMFQMDGIEAEPGQISEIALLSRCCENPPTLFLQADGAMAADTGRTAGDKN